LSPTAILSLIGGIIQVLLPLLAEAPHAGAEAQLRPLLDRYCTAVFRLPAKQRANIRVLWDIKIAVISTPARAVVNDRMRPLQYAATRHDCERDVGDILAEIDR